MEIQSYHKTSSKIIHKPVVDIKDVYDILDSKLNKVTENFVTKINKKLIKNVMKFFIDSYNNWKCDKATDPMIPVGALMIGVNFSDHRKLFNCLAENAKEYSCKLISINSVACKKKKILEVLYRQILDEMNDIPKSFKGSMDFIIQYLLTQASTWRTQIVLVLEDIENFDCAEIVQTMNVFSLYRQRCSFIVLFGVCSIPDIIMEKLSAKCLSQVILTYFQSPSPMELLNGFLSEIVKEKFPFMLNYSTCNYVIEQFLHTDYSVNSIVQHFKICLHRHLCSNVEYTQLIRSYLKETKSNSDDINDSKLQFQQFYLYWDLFQAICKWMMYFSNKMTVKKSGFSFHSILSAHLKSGIAKSEQLKSVLYSLKFEVPPTEISKFIEEANSALLKQKESNKENQSSATLVLSCLVQEIAQTFQTNSKRNEVIMNKLSETLINWLNDNLPHYSTSYQLKPFFMTLNDKEAIQNLTNPSILSLLRRDLLHPHKQNTVHSIKRQSSKKYRTKTDSDCSNDNTNAGKPDLSVLYQLINEQSNHTINKFDLLQSYASVIENGKEDDDMPSKDVQSRFQIGLMELGMLGLVESSKSRPDTLTKLYWPGVF